MLCIGAILVGGAWGVLLIFETVWLTLFLSTAALFVLIPAFFVGKMGRVKFVLHEDWKPTPQMEIERLAATGGSFIHPDLQENIADGNDADDVVEDIIEEPDQVRGDDHTERET